MSLINGHSMSFNELITIKWMWNSKRILKTGSYTSDHSWLQTDPKSLVFFSVFLSVLRVPVMIARSTDLCLSMAAFAPVWPAHLHFHSFFFCSQPKHYRNYISHKQLYEGHRGPSIGPLGVSWVFNAKVPAPY